MVHGRLHIESFRVASQKSANRVIGSEEENIRFSQGAECFFKHAFGYMAEMIADQVNPTP